jgi:transposase
MAYRYGDRTQLTFLSDSIDKYVGQDDPVRVYDTFINALDINDLGLRCNSNCVGNSSYDPITMLKILVYSYSYGWRSSRKIERALHHNLSFIWLAGGLKPDHKTISRFRKENKKVLKNVLKQNARMCLKLGLIEGNTLFVDGSKIRANAGKLQTKCKGTWEKYQGQIETRIEEILNECETIDQSEQESLVKVEKELQSKKKLKSKIEELLQEMKEEDIEKINGTDPDSKIMKSRQGSHSAYNCQIVTDEANGLIVSTDATSEMNDLNQLTDQVVKAEQTLEKESEVNCADAGYSSVEDLKTLVDKGKTVIVPTNKQAQHDKKGNRVDPFEKHAFVYDEEEDTYTCPAGNKLYSSSTRKESGRTRIEYRLKHTTICRNCKYFGKCTKSKTGRRLYRLFNEATKKTLEKIYESQEGQEIYAKRKMLVEHQFGHIKQNLGVKSFLLRRLDGAKAELSLLGTCFNLSRMITLMGGVRPAMEQIKQFALSSG